MSERYARLPLRQKEDFTLQLALKTYFTIKTTKICNAKDERGCRFPLCALSVVRRAGRGSK